MPAGNVRVQQVLRGRAEVGRRAPLSSLRGDVALAPTSDAAGQVLFEDVPSGWFGYQEGRGVDARDVVYGQSIGFLERGRRWLDGYQFFQQREWYQGARRSRCYVCDAIGGGPLEDAFVVQGTSPGTGLADRTREGGVVFVTRDFAGRATAARRSERDGRVVVHAFSIVTPDGEHLELPLQRVWRTPVGAFERHGIVAGAVVGADPARDLELRATRTLRAQEWWSAVTGEALGTPALPLDVDPALGSGGYAVGVPAPGGNVAIAETTSPGGLKTLQRAGYAAGVVPAEGGRVSRDLALDLVATQVFTVPGALANAPAELDPAQLELALALELPDGLVVDVARGLRGNHAAAGADLQLTLPPLAGAPAGASWLAVLHGSYAAGGATVGVARLLRLPELDAGPPAFRAFPVLAAPAGGATVAASGFTAQYTLPPETVYARLELRADTGAETLLWQAVVPQHIPEFPFVALPPEVPTPLLAGRTYTLTLTAFFGSGVVTTTENPYRSATTFLQSVGPIEAGLTQTTSRSVQITAN
jgi:hypothetical protein